MTTPVQMRRPEGEAAELYEEALRLEREVANAVYRRTHEEAERLRGLAREAWKKFREFGA